MKILLAVFIGGGIGSIARYGISHYAVKFIDSGFPWGTMISNLLACLVLAGTVFALRGRLDDTTFWRFFIITGFCGGFSTFSTFSFENYILMRSDHLMMALVNVVVSVVIGLAIMFVLLKDIPLHE